MSGRHRRRPEAEHRAHRHRLRLVTIRPRTISSISCPGSVSDHESRIWSREGRSIDVDGYVERIENLQRSPEALFLIRAEVIADDRLSEDARQFLDARI